MATVGDSGSVPSKKGKSEKIQVIVRIRPMIGREEGSNKSVFALSDTNVHVDNNDKQIECRFDRV
jgi:hypothetical protein